MTTFDELVNQVAVLCFEDAMETVEMYDNDDKKNGLDPLPNDDRIRYHQDLAETTLASIFGDEVRAKIAMLCEDHYK